MNIDEIVEAISKTESWDDLQRIARALKSRSDNLSQLALQRVKQNFKMGIFFEACDAQFESALLCDFLR